MYTYIIKTVKLNNSALHCPKSSGLTINFIINLKDFCYIMHFEGTCVSPGKKKKFHYGTRAVCKHMNLIEFPNWALLSNKDM